MFNPLASEFNVENAIFLANISELVYLDENEIKAKLQLEKETNTNFAFIVSENKSFDTESIIIADENAIIIAFRGTEKDSSADWVSNLDNRLLPKFTGNIHQGFWETLGQVWTKITEKLDIFRDKNQPIWLTGHSQGGALAMLAGRILQEYNIEIQGIYTYGQPKVGDMLFASNFNAFLLHKTFRIYNIGDSIPENPPSLYHAGTAVEVNENGNINIKTDFNLLESGGSGIASILDALFDFATDGAKAHSLQEYIKRLTTQL